MIILLQYFKSSVYYLRQCDINWCCWGNNHKKWVGARAVLTQLSPNCFCCTWFHFHRWLYCIHATEKPLFWDYGTPHIWQWSSSNYHVVSPQWLLAKEGEIQVGDRQLQLVFLVFSSSILMYLSKYVIFKTFIFNLANIKLYRFFQWL